MKWRSQQNDGKKKKKIKKRNHGKFLAAWNEDHNKTMAKKEEEKNEWRSQNQMLEEQKMLISVLVVCLTIEFGSMR